MEKTYYPNEPIKDYEEIERIFELYEVQGVLHLQDMRKLEEYLSPPSKETLCKLLSEELEDYVNYNEETKAFYTCEYNDCGNLITFENGYLYFNISLKPELVHKVYLFYLKESKV